MPRPIEQHGDDRNGDNRNRGQCRDCAAPLLPPRAALGDPGDRYGSNTAGILKAGVRPLVFVLVCLHAHLIRAQESNDKKVDALGRCLIVCRPARSRTPH